MLIENENKTVEVFCGTKQTGETRLWDWVERSIWTDRMLEALEAGVKGGVWFSLIDKVYRPQTLYAAWKAVKRNRGSAGTDHESIEWFERKLEENIKKLSEEIRTGTYYPRPIKRRYIDKPGSKEKRPLGIPAVRDRVVQTTIRLVIEPIFERQFRHYSYGFRPKRGCKDALREVEKRLKAGYSHVVDADLKAYFDSIPHDRLMQDVQRYIADGRLLKLIENFLKQDVLDGLAQWTPEAGTPQGAVISPMLANLYLHPVDQAMEEAGFIMIRYADDFVIMCKDEKEVKQAMCKVSQLITERGLVLHPEKTRIVNTNEAGQGFDFLGYHFERGTRWPRKKSLKKLKDTIRSQTGRSNGHSMAVITANLNRTLRGWFEYFKHSHKWTFRILDGWTRRRLRSILRKRNKGAKGISGKMDHFRWPNKFFQELGLYSLEEAHALLLQSSKR
ncbi:MAG: group II intron reverse transcriptase/maturase [Smithellaceae bacterium]|nr:group II intron reverse transcriptase/maturase [Smithellaceae bacterium]